MTIIRNDRGLDFKRIEKLISNFHKKSSSIIQGYRKEKERAIKAKETKAFEHFGLTIVIEDIGKINTQIKELEEKRREHESKIRDYTQGIDKDRRYNSYDTIREGSPIHQYINDVEINYQENEVRLKQIDESLEEQLWVAPDIDIAYEIIKAHEQLRADITGNSNP